MDKCFCHLNGYAVKDATARTEIVNIKETYATKDELNAIEIPNVDLTPYATIEYVDGKVRTYTTLYDNTDGTSEAFTLSDNVTNYDYIRVYYSHGDSSHSVEAVAKQDVQVCLEAYYITDEHIYFQQKTLKFNNKNVTIDYQKNGDVASGSLYTTDTSSSKIYRVVGIK